MNNKELERRVEYLEKLLSKKQMKNEGVFRTLMNDPEMVVKFKTLMVAIKKAWSSLHKLEDTAKECDQAIIDAGADPDMMSDAETISGILNGVLNDLYTLGYMTDLEYNADDEYDDDEE